MKNGSRPHDACGAHSVVSGRALSPDKSSRRKRIHKAAQAALLALSFLATSSAYAANDWVNFATVSMTNATTPKLTNGYGCYTDGKDVLCDSKTSAITFGTGGLIDMGGLTVAGSISAAAVSATYISGTVIQVNTSSMPCSAGLAGTIRYNSGNIEYCNGSAWGQLANGSGGTLSGGSATAIAFWSGPSSLTYESATTGGLYWDHTNGRLGVGTNAPTTPFEVSATSGNVARFGTAAGIGNVAYIDIANFRSAIGYDGTTSNTFIQANSGKGINFNVNNNTFGSGTAVTIAPSGNVGMGTSAPAYRLEVKQATGGVLPGINIVTDTATARASMGFGLDAGTTTGWIIGQSKDQTQKDFYIYDVAKGVFRMVFDTSGSIGIGTASPGSSLTVVGGEIQTGTSGGACTTATNGGAIRYSAGTLYYCNGSNTWTTISGGGAGFTGGGSATAIAFWNGTNSLTYESTTTSGLYWDHTNGRLGIGTNAPAFTVDVSGSQSGVVRYQATNSNPAGAADMKFINDNGGFIDTQIFGSTYGTLSFGLPSQNLARVIAVSSSLLAFGTSDNAPVMFATGNAERMRITSAGNVGIGIVTPTATLQVSGTLTVSTTGQNTASAASLLVDSRGVSVSSIVHITGSAFSPIGAGGNAILSGTTAVSTSSAGSITFYAGGSRIGGFNTLGSSLDANGVTLAPDGGYLGLGAYYTGGNWVNSVTGQGGAAIRNSAGVMTFYSDASPGTAGTAFSSFAEKMRLQSNGYLALGTQSASAHFHIAGDTNNGASWPKAGIMLEDTGTNGRAFSISSRGSAGFGIADETSHLIRLTIGSNGVATFYGVSNCTIASGTGTTSCTSDRRLKDRIEPIKDPLDKLMLINGVTYHWKRKDISGPEHIGVIAQDVEKAFPQAVTEVSDSTIGTAKTVDYSILVAPIIEVIKGFKHRFESTDAKLKAANDNIQTLSNEVEELRQEVRQLKQQK